MYRSSIILSLLGFFFLSVSSVFAALGISDVVVYKYGSAQHGWLFDDERFEVDYYLSYGADIPPNPNPPPISYEARIFLFRCNGSNRVQIGDSWTGNQGIINYSEYIHLRANQTFGYPIGGNQQEDRGGTYEVEIRVTNLDPDCITNTGSLNVIHCYLGFSTTLKYQRFLDGRNPDLATVPISELFPISNVKVIPHYINTNYDIIAIPSLNDNFTDENGRYYTPAVHRTFIHPEGSSSDYIFDVESVIYDPENTTPLISVHGQDEVELFYPRSSRSRCTFPYNVFREREGDLNTYLTFPTSPDFENQVLITPTSSDEVGSLAIGYTILKGREWAKNRFNGYETYEDNHEIEVEWDGYSSAYVPNTNHVIISRHANANSTGPDQYNDCIVLHEYGHYLSHWLGISPENEVVPSVWTVLCES